MKAYNLVASLIVLFSMIMQFEIFAKFGQVEAKGKGKKCKIEFRHGEYVVYCPKKIPNKESQRTFSRKRGPRGRKGDKGMPGPMGPPGQKGLPGPAGRTGPQGPIGPMGPTGAEGKPGVTGPQGTKGDRGDLGPTGAQGPPGMPGNCLSDSPIYVQRNGVHCLPGPIGPQGKKGTTGPQGIKGVPGEKGETGQTGKQGGKGSRGPVGLPGLPGTLGKISCMTRYTQWIRQDDVYQMGNLAVLCHAAEFLQGFVVEMRRTDLRYRYYCCAFT